MRHFITTYPNKGLFTETKEIPKKDIKTDTFSQIGAAMLDVLKDRGGIGLSANQVGLPFKMCVIDVSAGQLHMMLNPRLVKVSDEIEKSREGCLSIPGASLMIDRHKMVSVEYESVTGETETLHDVTGLLAYCIQHEIDHLNGKLMIDRVNQVHRSKALKEMQKYIRNRKNFNR